MPKEEGPLEYKHRVLDTKAVAQRIDLDYLKRIHWRALWRRRSNWILVAAAAAAVPLLLFVGGGKKAFSAGPVSRAHAIFESNCKNCHAVNFREVTDKACLKCHDGPPHPAKDIDKGVPLIHSSTPKDQVRCGQCHVEHRGNVTLASVSDKNCTACHASLKDHGSGVLIQSVKITSFRKDHHPDFPPVSRTDVRPIKLNHKVHLELEAKKYPTMKLPMKCSDCHQTDPDSPKGDLLPVTFDKHCKSCHFNELDFDVFQLLQPKVLAPHTKNPNTIGPFVAQQFQNLVAQNPGIVNQTLLHELDPIGNQSAWLQHVTEESQRFLFSRKCNKCHEYEGQNGLYPIVKKVNVIRGQYVEGKPEGAPWLERGEFSHRAHRAVDCSSCHTAAKTSKLTSDVLIPKMQNCTPCHGSSGTAIDNCAECHLYHNKAKEKDKYRRPVDELVTRVLPWQ